MWKSILSKRLAKKLKNFVVDDWRKTLHKLFSVGLLLTYLRKILWNGENENYDENYEIYDKINRWKRNLSRYNTKYRISFYGSFFFNIFVPFIECSLTRNHIESSKMQQHKLLQPLVKQFISMKPGQCNIRISCPGQNDEWFNLIDSCDAVYSRNLTFTNSIDHFTLSRAVGFSFFLFNQCWSFF